MSLQVTIGFSTTNKLISRFIRWVTRGKVSHAWISFYDDCLGTRFVMQAETWGYEVRPLARWKRENILVAEFDVPGDVSDSLKWIAESLGAPYDWSSAILSGLRRWLGRWLRGQFHSPRKLMCSEAVIRFLFHAGILPEQLDPETTPPARLLKVISASDDFRKLVP